MNNAEDDKGFLEDEWQTRKYVKSEETKKQNFTSNKTVNQTNKKISNTLKYGKHKDEVSGYTPLKLSEKLRIAEGYTQAIIKVTSYGKGKRGIMKHLTYISRDFDLELEDQDGSLLMQQPDAKELLDTWSSIYFDQRKNSRDTLHMVFSAPPETDRDTFKNLTREFLHDEYGGEHDYVFVAHDDKDHPHIHSVICMRSIQGKKLDPRKKYLHELRKRFAKKCRENGIQVDASRRFERGLSGQSAKSPFVQMRRKRQVIPDADQTLLNKISREGEGFVANDVSKSYRDKRNQAIRKQFYDEAKSLYESQKNFPEHEQSEWYLRASKVLLDYSKSMPKEITRAERLYQKRQMGRVMINEKLQKNKDIRQDFDV